MISTSHRERGETTCLKDALLEDRGPDNSGIVHVQTLPVLHQLGQLAADGRVRHGHLVGNGPQTPPQRRRGFGTCVKVVIGALQLKLLEPADDMGSQNRLSRPGICMDPVNRHSVIVRRRLCRRCALKLEASPFTEVVPSLEPFARSVDLVILFIWSVGDAEKCSQRPELVT